MKNYKYILFDWDGCLARTLQIWLAAYKSVSTKHNVHFSDKEIVDKVFGNWNNLSELGIKNVDEYVSNVLTMVGKELPNVELYDGAKELLDTLKNKGKILALLTSSKRQNVLPALKNNNLELYFEIVIAADDVENHKPHPEVIETALKKMNGNKGESIKIGDSHNDLEAANNAKIDSVLFYPPEHAVFYDFDNLKSYNPTHIISSLNDLSDILT